MTGDDERRMTARALIHAAAAVALLTPVAARGQTAAAQQPLCEAPAAVISGFPEDTESFGYIRAVQARRAGAGGGSASAAIVTGQAWSERENLLGPAGAIAPSKGRYIRLPAGGAIEVRLAFATSAAGAEVKAVVLRFADGCPVARIVLTKLGHIHAYTADGRRLEQ